MHNNDYLFTTSNSQLSKFIFVKQTKHLFVKQFAFSAFSKH